MSIKQEILGLASLLTFLVPIQSILAQEAPSASENSPVISTIPKEREATPYQKAIIKTVMYLGATDDLEKGKDNPLVQKFPGLFPVTVEKISSDYDSNEFKADKTYKGKWLLIEGRVKAARNYSDGPTLSVIPIGKDYPTINALFEHSPGIEDKMAALDTEGYITMICQGAGKKILPALKNCLFFNDEVNNSYSLIRDKFIEAIEGKGNKAENAEAALFILKLEQILGPDKEKACEKGPEYCVKELESLEIPNDTIPQSFYDLGYTDDMLKKK